MIKINSIDKIQKILESLLKIISRKLPSDYFAKEEVFRTYYGKLYGNSDYKDALDGLRYKNLKNNILIFMMILPILGYCLYHDLSVTTEGVNLKNKHMISIKRPDVQNGEKKINAEAVIERAGLIQSIPVTLTIKPQQDELSEDEKVEQYEREQEKLKHDPERIWEETLRNFRFATNSLNKNTEGDSVNLPQALEPDATVKWKLKRESDTVAAVILLAFMLAILYTKRHQAIKKEYLNAKESIMNDLPDFINKLILMLNAGLVIHSAFIKTLNDYRDNRKKNIVPDSYFYNQLYEIKIRISETNSALAPELREFASRSGVPEFVRITNIITDNIGLGAGLVEKLSMEGELLWFSRKKRAAEKGRLAETKLTFPLMLLLLALVMVTTAPALLDM